MDSVLPANSIAYLGATRCEPRKAVRARGAVYLFGSPRISNGPRNSFQDSIKVRMARTDSPGVMIGRTTRVNVPNTEQPSIAAASSSSSGTEEEMYWRIITYLIQKPPFPARKSRQIIAIGIQPIIQSGRALILLQHLLPYPG